MAGGLSDERPIFVQIAELLEDAVLSGAYAEETQVPSITEFSVAYRINPATALKGVNLLVEQGILYKKRGLGMFVSAGARETLKKRRRELFHRDYVRPLMNEAARLGIGKEEVAEMLKWGGHEHVD